MIAFQSSFAKSMKKKIIFPSYLLLKERIYINFSTNSYKMFHVKHFQFFGSFFSALSKILHTREYSKFANDDI